MLEMLFASGMRISELINLNLEDINCEGKLYIIGKGKKPVTATKNGHSTSASIVAAVKQVMIKPYIYRVVQIGNHATYTAC